MTTKLNISAIIAFAVHSSVAASPVQVTDDYMSQKGARIVEIHQLCAKYADASRGGIDHKQLLLSVCAFDTAHTTGFNATTQARGKMVDLAAVQTSAYTMKLLTSVQVELSRCQGARGGGVIVDNDLYCVAMRGYQAGKLYGQRYLDGKPM